MFPIQSKGLYLYPCVGVATPELCDKCKLYSFHKYKYEYGNRCARCTDIVAVKNRKIRKLVESPTQHRPIQFMSYEALEEQTRTIKEK